MSLASQISALATRIATEFNTARDEVSGVVVGLQSLSEKGAANGYASLDGSGDLTLAQLPVHASSHGSGGSDPVSPASIGAATSSHTHGGAYNLAYAATLSADYNNGTHQYTTLTGDAILGVPTNIPSGAVLVYSLYASGANRTVTIDSGIVRQDGLISPYVIPSGKTVRFAVENNPRGGAGGTASPLLIVLGPTQPYDSDLADFAALTPANDDIPQRKSGAWTNRTMAQLRADLVPAPYSFTYAATYAPNWTNGEHHYCTSLTGDITIQEPTNIPSGKVLTIEMIATTSPRTVTVDSTIQRLAGINPTFVVDVGKMLKLSIENSPVLSDTILIAKGGT